MEGSEQQDFLAGITAKTTKAEMMDLLKKAQAVITRQNTENVGRLQEIEDRVRTKWKPYDQPELRNVVVSATDEEWADTLEFLSDLEDVLPVMLKRLVTGANVLKEQLNTPQS